jgi:hypothetical protein
LAGRAVCVDVGHVVAPLVGLVLEFSKGSEGSQGPEAVLSQFSLEAILRYALPLLSTVNSQGEQHGDEFQGGPFSQDIILMYVRWYVAYPLSYR